MPLRELFLRNLRWKVAALVLAVFVWFAIKYTIWRGGGRPGDEEAVTLDARTVMVLQRPDDSGIFQLQPGQVDVVLRGPASLVRAMDTNLVHVFVDLTSVPEVTPPTITQVLARAPSGIQVVRVAPMAVVVERLNPGPSSN